MLDRSDQRENRATNMTNRTRQPPEPICMHWDIMRFLIGRKCKAGVDPKDVTHGDGNMCVGTMPCMGICPQAKCAKKQLHEPEPESKPDPQGKLFE